MTKSVNVGIIGLGTVGTGVARILLDSADDLAARAGVRINLLAACDKDLTRDRGLKLPSGVLTDNLDDVLNNPQIDVICELIGGTTLAYDIVERALRAGKSVVTANKALLAERGEALVKLARDNGLALCFEPAVAGGIPLILAIRDGLVANRITALTGIVNGTCNYILSNMSHNGASYEGALAEAQQKGYAEADPTLDVSGGDSAHKLTILGRLAFQVGVRYEDVYCEGIQNIDLLDVRFGAELGYAIKLLAIGRLEDDDTVSLRVHPAFVADNSPLAHVGGPFNAVMVTGDAVGDTLYYGAGAGQMPTASAVVADIVDAALGRAQITSRQRDSFMQLPNRRLRTIDEIVTRYYLRFDVADQPGVLARIAGILGELDISISSVLQHEPTHDDHVPLIILTHKALERNMRLALSRITELDAVHGRPVSIRVTDLDGRG